MKCAQNKPSPCAPNRHIPGHLCARVDELTETRKIASTCHSAVLCQLALCTSAQGLTPLVGAAHTQTPQASAGTRAEGTGPARCKHAISTGPQSSTRLSPPSLSRPPTLRVLGCHLADRLGVMNPPRTPPRRFPGGDATTCGRCFFQPDAGVVFFNPRLTSWPPPHAGYPLMNRGGAHGQYPGRGVLSRTITRCTPPSRPSGVRAWRDEPVVPRVRWLVVRCKRSRAQGGSACPHSGESCRGGSVRGCVR